MSQSLGWPLRVTASDLPEASGATGVLACCGPLFKRAVLVVPRSPADGWVVRQAKSAGAMVTVLCGPERAQDAKDEGADAVMDPERQDPTWYRGAWTVIYDPAGRIGFARAARSLGRRGAYLTARASLGDRTRALASWLGGGPRLLRLGSGRAA